MTLISKNGFKEKRKRIILFVEQEKSLVKTNVLVKITYFTIIYYPLNST